MWTLLLALWLVCVSSDGWRSNVDPIQMEDCEAQSLMAQLGSSVLLPCLFTTKGFDWVTWAHVHELDLDTVQDLVGLSTEGRVKFLDPRHGRVKTFPNQASVGNFSICIDELRESDFGFYICKKENKCVSVKLHADKGTLHANVWSLISICVGVAALILLCLFGYCCYESLRNKRSQDDANNTAAPMAPCSSGPSAPPQEQGHEHHMGADDNSLVYENDDQYMVTRDPTRNQSAPAGILQHSSGAQSSQSNVGIYPNIEEFKFERVESQRTRRFHIELISRLRQASLSRHFYANQQEINKQQAMAPCSENQGAVLASDGDYQNPIYNRSMDQLNRL
ncbi:uncharacterized protein [Nothobranchius furzeri]|uniref:uncharacterized protein isoform X2 n=1 Tax=Nothobranchius furzeri TaxID=105023 RepID=UPI00390488A7